MTLSSLDRGRAVPGSGAGPARARTRLAAGHDRRWWAERAVAALRRGQPGQDEVTAGGPGGQAEHGGPDNYEDPRGGWPEDGPEDGAGSSHDVVEAEIVDDEDAPEPIPGLAAGFRPDPVPGPGEHEEPETGPGEARRAGCPGRDRRRGRTARRVPIPVTGAARGREPVHRDGPNPVSAARISAARISAARISAVPSRGGQGPGQRPGPGRRTDPGRRSDQGIVPGMSRSSEFDE